VKGKLQFVPWKYIADWKCIACGDCCKLYSVVINFNEWLRIIRDYGVENTASDLNKLLINRRNDGSCAFLNNGSASNVCGLQHMKPKACQLWPFKVLFEPKFGFPDEASYFLGEKRLFIYADSNCHGLTLGRPTWEFANSTLKEFVELAAGLRNIQFKTTSNMWSARRYQGFRTI